jgi:hypothetical protein
MAKTRVKKPNSGPIGVTPTTSQKLLYVASKLGIDISGMQGSTVNLFDTLNLVTTAGRQTMPFFQNTGSKSSNFSNFQQGTLNAGETLVIEKVKIWLLILSAGADLTSDATTIDEAYPIAAIPDSGVVSKRFAFQLGTIDVKIANSTVVKEYQVNECNPNFNRMTTGISPSNIDVTDSKTSVFGVFGQQAIILDAPPVIPMNQKFQVLYSFGPLGTIAPNLALMMSVGEFGTIYASKTTF